MGQEASKLSTSEATPSSLHHTNGDLLETEENTAKVVDLSKGALESVFDTPLADTLRHASSTRSSEPVSHKRDLETMETLETQPSAIGRSSRMSRSFERDEKDVKRLPQGRAASLYDASSVSRRSPQRDRKVPSHRNSDHTTPSSKIHPRQGQGQHGKGGRISSSSTPSTPNHTWVNPERRTNLPAPDNMLQTRARSPIRVRHNGIEGVPVGPRKDDSLITRVIDVAQIIPCLQIVTLTLRPQQSQVKHVRGMLAAYWPYTVRIDADGYWIQFPDTSEGHGRLRQCAKACKQMRLHGEHELKVRIHHSKSSKSAPQPNGKGSAATSQHGMDIATKSSTHEESSNVKAFRSRPVNAEQGSHLVSPSAETSQARGSRPSATSHYQTPTSAARLSSSTQHRRTTPSSLDSKSAISSAAGHKQCHVCTKNSSIEADPLIQCSHCPRRYHPRCHPSVIPSDGTAWRCQSCCRKRKRSSAGSDEGCPLRKDIFTTAPLTTDRQGTGTARVLPPFHSSAQDQVTVKMHGASSPIAPATESPLAQTSPSGASAVTGPFGDIQRNDVPSIPSRGPVSNDANSPGINGLHENRPVPKDAHAARTDRESETPVGHGRVITDENAPVRDISNAEVYEKSLACEPHDTATVLASTMKANTTSFPTPASVLEIPDSPKETVQDPRLKPYRVVHTAMPDDRQSNASVCADSPVDSVMLEETTAKHSVPRSPHSGRKSVADALRPCVRCGKKFLRGSWLSHNDCATCRQGAATIEQSRRKAQKSPDRNDNRTGFNRIALVRDLPKHDESEGPMQRYDSGEHVARGESDSLASETALYAVSDGHERPTISGASITRPQEDEDTNDNASELSNDPLDFWTSHLTLDGDKSPLPSDPDAAIDEPSAYPLEKQSTAPAALSTAVPKSCSPLRSAVNKDTEKMTTLSKKRKRAHDVESGRIRRQKDEPPAYRYDQLIYMALVDAPNHRLQTRSICKWIERNVSGHILGEGIWENGVGATLSMHHGSKHKRLWNMQPRSAEDADGDGKGAWYQLPPGVAETLDRWDPVLKEAVSPIASPHEAETEDKCHDTECEHANIRPGGPDDTAVHELVVESSGEAVLAPQTGLDIPGLRDSGDSIQEDDGGDHMEIDKFTSHRICAGEDMQPAHVADDTAHSVVSDSSDNVPLITRRQQFTVPTAVMHGIEAPESRDTISHDSTVVPRAMLASAEAAPTQAAVSTIHATSTPGHLLPRKLARGHASSTANHSLPKRPHESASLVKSFFDEWPEHSPHTQAGTLVTSATIKRRPTRKEMFGKPASRSRLTNESQMNEMDSDESRHSAAEAATGRSPAKRAKRPLFNFTPSNPDEQKTTRYDTVEDFFDLPTDAIPIMHGQELVFRDGVRDVKRNLPRAKAIYKPGRPWGQHLGHQRIAVELESREGLGCTDSS